MVKMILILTTIVTFLTGANIFLIGLVDRFPYLYIALFLVNLVSVISSSYLIKVMMYNKSESKPDEDTSTEESVSVFIKVLIYTLPIIGLIGLYFVSILNDGGNLTIEDANSWVSFILGIAAFTMALVTLWQSEWTYNKIFSTLDQLKIDTTEIKKHNDIEKVFREQNFTLNKENNSETEKKDSDNLIHQAMTTNPFTRKVDSSDE